MDPTCEASAAEDKDSIKVILDKFVPDPDEDLRGLSRASKPAPLCRGRMVRSDAAHLNCVESNSLQVSVPRDSGSMQRS